MAIRRRRRSRDATPPDRAALQRKERDLMRQLREVQAQMPPRYETVTYQAPEHR